MESTSLLPKAICIEIPYGGSEAPARVQFARNDAELWFYDDPNDLSEEGLMRLAGPTLLALSDAVFQRVLEGHCLRRKNSEISKSNLFLLTDGTVGLLIPELVRVCVDKNPTLRFEDGSPVAEIILPECADNHAALSAMERARTWLPIARSLLRVSDSDLAGIETPAA